MTAGAIEKDVLDDFASDQKRQRAQAYERSTLQRMLQVKTSPSKLLAKMLLENPPTRALPAPRRAMSAATATTTSSEEAKREQQLLYVPFRYAFQYLSCIEMQSTLSENVDYG